MEDKGICELELLEHQCEIDIDPFLITQFIK